MEAQSEGEASGQAVKGRSPEPGENLECWLKFCLVLLGAGPYSSDYILVMNKAWCQSSDEHEQ